MSSLQTILPSELATIRLYHECLRRAKYIGQKKYNAEFVIDMVRQQFKRHTRDRSRENQKLKDDAARGLINHRLYESENLVGQKFSKRSG